MKIRNIIGSMIFCFFISKVGVSQFTMQTIQIDTTTRTYYKHIPANYDPSQPASIVVWLHGMGNITINQVQQLFAANQFVPISDTANFILLVPVAVNYTLLNMRAWNSHAGLLGVYPNTDVNDFKLIDKMLDETINSYQVNQQQIYLCGFSMGGFMTERMALLHNSRFAAFASVSGTIGSGVDPSANPFRTIPVAHFHGTADNNVKYTDNPYGIDPDSLVNFWIQHDGASATPISHTTYTDIGQNDTVTVDHFIYGTGKQDVEFFKENNAVHEWLPKTSQKVWIFFRKHTFADLSVKQYKNENSKILVYPNPTANELHLSILNDSFQSSYSISLYNLQGKKVYQLSTHKKSLSFSIGENLPKGIYILQVGNNKINYRKKIVIDK